MDDKEPIVVRRSIFRTAVIVELLAEDIGATMEDITGILRETFSQRENKSTGNYIGQVHNFIVERDVQRPDNARIEVKPDIE